MGSPAPGGGSLIGARPSWIGDLNGNQFHPEAKCSAQPLPSLAAPAAAADVRASGGSGGKSLSVAQIRALLVKAGLVRQGAASSKSGVWKPIAIKAQAHGTVVGEAERQMSGRMTLQIRRYGRYFMILLALIVIGTGAGFYILLQQRLPNPFKSFFQVSAEFPSAAAVVPGLGEPVNVAGVHVGEITGTELRNGQGVINMEIDPSKLPGDHLYRDAHADLVPNTPLKDMQVNINPGNGRHRRAAARRDDPGRADHVAGRRR